MNEEPILEMLTSDIEQGVLHIKDIRYLLIRPETLITVQKALEAEVGFDRAGEILYPGGFTGGRLSGERYRREFGLTEREAVAFMCRMGGEIGWGRFEPLELDEETHQLRVRVENSPFAKSYGTGAPGGVCHLIRGVLGGLGAGIFNTEVIAQETHCEARGDAECRFEVRSAK
jgi:predicted hydrocarbon binding protein